MRSPIESAEAAAESDQIPVGELLAAEEDDEMIEPSAGGGRRIQGR